VRGKDASADSHLPSARALVYLVFERFGSVVFAVAFRWALLGRIPGLEAGGRIRTDGAVVATLFSRSDNAKSCFMIAAFSHFSGRLGFPTHSFTTRASTATASTASAIATPVDDRPIMSASLARVVESVCQIGILRWQAWRNTGY
jgi:hypothetical protein